MKIILLTGILTGFLGVLAGAYYVPWGEHLRLPSKTTVQANGGRLEQFMIRLPLDRIDGTDPGRPGSANGNLPVSVANGTVRLQHFKLRDVDANVIGIAARHWTVTPAGPATVWSIVIPSRGGFALTAAGEAAGALDDALARAGHQAGADWSGDVEIRQTPAEESATRLAFGSEEFAGVEGSYSEVWRITGVGEEGELRGTIELATTILGGL